MKVTVEGKRGTRSPLLIPAVGHLTDWLRDHPAGDDPAAPLWSHLTRPDAISNNRARDIFKAAADRADITPPTAPTPSAFRKASASYLASRGVSQAHLEDHHGWTRGSDVASRYIAVFGEANDREIARAHGVDVATDDDGASATPCPRCDQLVPPGQDVCGRCSQALDPELGDALTALNDLIDDRLKDADDRVSRERLIEARRGLDANPGAVDVDTVHEILSSSGK
jgi:hypothetical protein